MFRLNPITFVVAGVALILTTIAGFYFLKIRPEQEEMGYWIRKNQKLDEIISEGSKTAAVERVREAMTKVRDAESAWKLIAQRRTPSAGQINLTPQRWQLVVNTRRWHGRVEADLRKWIRRGGVRLVSPAGGIQVPFPTDMPNELVQYYFNYPAFPFPIAIWDLGAVTVAGTYDQIMSHVKSWSAIPHYIASVRGLSLTGSGSRLQATYGLTLVVYINTQFVSGGPAEGGKVPDMGSTGDQAQGGQNQSGTMAKPGAGGGGAGGAGAGPTPIAIGGGR
ncbi:MAG: hypothetical protein ACR2HJ_01235 [Fimbriimonadales bacterium]